MNNKSKIVIAFLALILLVLPVFALTVSTNKASYNTGELVTITGYSTPNVYVTIDVTNPSGNPFHSDTVITGISGNFSSVFGIANGSAFGIYNVTANYGVDTNRTQFSVVPINGTLTIQTTPGSGNVYLNGTLLGASPQTRSLAPGNYSITFGAVSGYETPASRIASVNSGNLTTIIGAYTAIVCGNGVCQSGESCSSCSQDCGSCSSGGGGGGTFFFPYTAVAAGAANLSIVTAQSNVPLYWKINRTDLLSVTAVNMTPKIGVINLNIQIKKIASFSPALDNAYEYYNITSGVADANISNAAISFAVNKTWIDQNKLNSSTVAMYRFSAGQWNSLVTSKTAEDATRIYYNSNTPGFSVFAISGQKISCPVCAPASDWSACISGVQTRTEYYCNENTGFVCASKTANQSCCPTCPDDTVWSDCIANKQSRTTYSCDAETSYQCKAAAEEKSCVSREEASAAISLARAAIDGAKLANKNTVEAEGLLSRANSYFTSVDYANAKSLADQAAASAKTAPLLPSAFPVEFVLIGIIIAVSAVLAYIVMKKKVFARKCVVCGQPTTMHYKCASCGKPMCYRHMVMRGGTMYCTNCITEQRRKSLYETPR